MLKEINFSLFQKGKLIRMDYKAHNIFLLVDTLKELNSRVTSCKGEPETVSWIEKNISKNDIFFDIGANVGAYGLIAAKSKKCKVYAFEPMSLNYYKLTENIKINKLNEYITPLNIALSDKDTIDRFNLSSNDAGSACHCFATLKNQENKNFIPMYYEFKPSLKLDTFVELYKIHPNFIKLDVDGIESNILKGAINTLKSNYVKSVLVEVNLLHDANAIKTFMKDLNFSLVNCFHIQNNSYNYIFDKKE